jgi:hypothetical protein
MLSATSARRIARFPMVSPGTSPETNAGQRKSFAFVKRLHIKSARVNRRNAFMVPVTGTQCEMFREGSSVTQVINEISHRSNHRHKDDHQEV